METVIFPNCPDISFGWRRFVHGQLGKVRRMRLLASVVFPLSKKWTRKREKAYHVCKKCGHRHLSGYVRDDNKVVWYGGGLGEIGSDGIYHDHSQASGSYGGDGGGDGGGE